MGALDSSRKVIRCLVTYTDWAQPWSSSVITVGDSRRRAFRTDLRSGLIESLEERTELCRRMRRLEDRDRRILFLWYVEQLPVSEVAREVGLSRRQCFRRRSKAIETLVCLGQAGASAG